MDALSGLYSLTGVSDPLHLGIGVLVALVLGGGFAMLILEVGRILLEYSGRGATAQAPPVQKVIHKPTPPPTPKAPEAAPYEAEKQIIEAPPETVEVVKQPAAPIVDVVKRTLKDSMLTMEKKYRLNAITLATSDGLVIASTLSEPDQEAAVYSSKFNELYRDSPADQYTVYGKDVYLYLTESSGNKVIGIAHRPVMLANEEITGLQEDTRKIIDKFAPGIKKH
ncbi:MAG TPA: hypothetical protein VK436_02190 [Methanocella sp.]|nr:hypothetical protein [Methanocella sp.]